MTYGGDGHGSGQGSTTDLCNFMFPGTSDPDFPGQEWTEVTAGNTPADEDFYNLLVLLLCNLEQ